MHNSMSQDEKYQMMTQTPIPALIGRLSVPTIISMMVTSFYNMADTFFVGKIDTSATAAVGIVFPVMAIIQALGFFCGHGSGNSISRKLLIKRWKLLPKNIGGTCCHRFFRCSAAGHGGNDIRVDFSQSAISFAWLHSDYSAVYKRIPGNHINRRSIYDFSTGAK